MKLNNQTVGNIGLYYVCYRLSLMGWNVMPTARNARGIDLLIYSQEGSRKLSVQVKALSKPSPVPLGTKLDNLFAGFFIICRKAIEPSPECFVLKPTEVRKLAHRAVKSDRVSHWLQPKDYDKPEFSEAWKRIRQGATEVPRGACR